MLLAANYIELAVRALRLHQPITAVRVPWIFPGFGARPRVLAISVRVAP
jgi:hypothetical protein